VSAANSVRGRGAGSGPPLKMFKTGPFMDTSWENPKGGCLTRWSSVLHTAGIVLGLKP
jgi:hypothetical protein